MGDARSPTITIACDLDDVLAQVRPLLDDGTTALGDWILVVT
jgi:hypothetical protein